MTVSATRVSATHVEKPGGLAFGVVFCWGLAAQLTLQGIAGTMGRLGLHHGAGGLAGRFAAALILVVVGEGLRRGIEWARLTTIAIAVLFTALAVADGIAFLGGHAIPRFLVFTDIVCLTFIPWIAWRLSLGRTAAWTASRRPGRAAAAVGWVVYAAFLADLLLTGILGGITLWSGDSLSQAPTALLELAVVPLVAWGIGRRRTSLLAPAAPTAGPRLQGRWVIALVVWSIPWGIVVASTQAIGVE